jgi:hypothetical protein
MKFIKRNSQEHRELMIEAIKSKNLHLLQGLKEANDSGCEEIVLLECFWDLFMRASEEETDESQYDVSTHEIQCNFIPELRRDDYKS